MFDARVSVFAKTTGGGFVKLSLTHQILRHFRDAGIRLPTFN